MAGGGLIITQHKSWNPGSRKTRAKVADAEARQREREDDSATAERRRKGDSRREEMRRRRGIKRKSRGDHTPEEREYERAREREEEIAHAERERRDEPLECAAARRALGREATSAEIRNAKRFQDESALGGTDKSRTRPWYALPTAPTAEGAVQPGGDMRREHRRALALEGAFGGEQRQPPVVRAGMLSSGARVGGALSGQLTGIAKLRAERLAREEVERKRAARLARGGR